MPSTTAPPAPQQPKPGCIVAFLAIFVLSTAAAWIWAFHPPMPSESDLTEVTGTVEKWEEKEVRIRRDLPAHELRIRLTGQKPEYLVEHYGYDARFKRSVATPPGTSLTLLVEKPDLEKDTAEVRTRGVRSPATEYFTLDDYRASVTERRSWGWAAATIATAFTLFAIKRVWTRRSVIFPRRGTSCPSVNR